MSMKQQVAGLTAPRVSCLQVLLMLEDEGDYASNPAGQQAGASSVSWLPLAVGGDTATTPTDLDFRLRSSRCPYALMHTTAAETQVTGAGRRTDVFRLAVHLCILQGRRH